MLRSQRIFGIAAFTLALALAGAAWIAAAEPEKPATADSKGWKKLFDAKSLEGWKSSGFHGSGKVQVKDGAIVLEVGKPMTGITYSRGDFPKMDYEVFLEAKKLTGDDFFCTTTFPVADSFCSLVVGGWGGQVVGLSSINGADASENETTTSKEFKRDQWYRIRIRVSQKLIEAWIDDDKVIDVATEDRKFSTRIECRVCQPFGIATYATTGAVRDIRVRKLSEEDKNAINRKKPLAER
jgi:hypothetical protein